MTYEELQATMPDHLTPEFLDWLRNTDPTAIVKELDNWLIVENIKYHNKEGYQDHWTAFYKHPEKFAYQVSSEAWKEIFDWMPTYRQVLINRDSERSIQLFHLHVIK